MPSLRFEKPGSWPTLAAAAGIALTLALGSWQLGRGRDKAALAQRIESTDREAPISLSGNEVDVDDVAWRKIEVHGRFEPQHTIFIDNRVLHGLVGYHVVTPLKIADSERYVLINRGWVEAPTTRGTLPQITTPRHLVDVTGMATPPSPRFLELSPQIVEGRIWQNLTIERFRATTSLPIQPVVIQQQNDLGDGLKREWPAADLGIDKHYGYAFQWFALAVAIFVFYLVAYVAKHNRPSN